MPIWGYSVKEFDPDRAVKCSGREIKISPKAAVEICRKLRGMRLDAAKELLEAVQKKKRAIAYRRYSKEVPHRSLEEGWYAGRYPVKAAKAFLFLLEDAELLPRRFRHNIDERDNEDGAGAPALRRDDV